MSNASLKPINQRTHAEIDQFKDLALMLTDDIDVEDVVAGLRADAERFVDDVLAAVNVDGGDGS